MCLCWRDLTIQGIKKFAVVLDVNPVANIWGRTAMETEVLVVAIFFIPIGAVSVAGGIFNLDWFMNQSKAVWIARIFGQQGARLFYIFLGSGMFIWGSTIVTIELIRIARLQ